jgi:hypothetical protein
MHRIAAASVVLLLVVAPAAQAKGDRAAAKAFGRATVQLRAAAVAQRQVIETGVNRLTRDPVCKDAFDHVPARNGAYGTAFALVITYSFEAQFGPMLPAMHDFVAQLDQVKVRDKRLRSGRAVLRRTAHVVSGLQPAPADICARLQAWQQAGYPAEGAPTIEDPAFDALLKLPESWSKKVDRAGKRLRELGVSRHAARLFTGDDDLFEGFDLDSEVPLGDKAG